MWKKILIGVLLIPILGAVGYYVANQKSIPFESVCDKANKKYTNLCDNVGKRAHSNPSMFNISDKDYGKIVGVAWRKKGSIISSSGREKRYSEQNAYYYIVSNNQEDYYFLRLASETDPR